jgi:hypothetical protein
MAVTAGWILEGSWTSDPPWYRSGSSDIAGDLSFDGRNNGADRTIRDCCAGC